MSQTIRAHFDGKVIVPDTQVDLPSNQPLEVEVRVLPSAEMQSPTESPMTDITALPFFGMWAEREDMKSSIEWVRKERDAWSRRVTDVD